MGDIGSTYGETARLLWQIHVGAAIVMGRVLHATLPTELAVSCC